MITHYHFYKHRILVNNARKEQSAGMMFLLDSLSTQHYADQFPTLLDFRNFFIYLWRVLGCPFSAQLV